MSARKTWKGEERRTDEGIEDEKTPPSTETVVDKPGNKRGEEGTGLKNRDDVGRDGIVCLFRVGDAKGGAEAWLADDATCYARLPVCARERHVRAEIKCKKRVRDAPAKEEDAAAVEGGVSDGENGGSMQGFCYSLGDEG